MAMQNAMIRTSGSVATIETQMQMTQQTQQSQHMGRSLAMSNSVPSMGTVQSFGESSATAYASSTHARYLGPLQPVVPRMQKQLPVVYDRGGSDFRCPHDVSSIGRQVLSWPHTQSAANSRFSESDRFHLAKYRSPGPKYGGPSSLGKQGTSKRPTLPSHGFGTSTRDHALKQYGVWSCR